MKSRIANVIALLLAMLLLASIAYNAGRSIAYSQSYEYYEKTEALLDSINNWDESFRDAVMETDAYYEYETARDKIK